MHRLIVMNIDFRPIRSDDRRSMMRVVGASLNDGATLREADIFRKVESGAEIFGRRVIFRDEGGRGRRLPFRRFSKLSRNMLNLLRVAVSGLIPTSASSSA